MHVSSRELVVATTEPAQIIDLTDRVGASGTIDRGLMSLMCLHTTAALLLGEFQEALLHDVRGFLARLVDNRAGYRHDNPEFSDCDRHNAAAHLRAMLLCPALSLPIVGGRPVLGRYQRILLVELDGPRDRRLHLQLLGEPRSLA